MKNRNQRFAEKTHRKGKGGRLAKGVHGEASVPLFASGSEVKPYDIVITEMMLERQKLIFALRGALHFYDRAMGNVETHDGWTAKDIRDLDEIRALAWGRKMEIL
jgi:hypothetical protein